MKSGRKRPRFCLHVRWRLAQFLQVGVCSAHSCNRFLTPLLHLCTFAHGFHFGHDVSERLLHRLLEEVTLALALHVLRVSQRGQGAVDVLQTDGDGHLQRTGRPNLSETIKLFANTQHILNSYIEQFNCTFERKLSIFF